MGASVHSGVYAQANLLHFVLRGSGSGNSFDFNFAVNHDCTNASGDCPGNLTSRFVVAVKTDSVCRDSAGECGGELSPACNIDVELQLVDPARNFNRHERLARVVNLCGCAN